MSKSKCAKRIIAVFLLGISVISLNTACNNPASTSVNKTPAELIVTAEPTATPMPDPLLQEEAISVINVILQTTAFSKSGLKEYLIANQGYAENIAEYAVNNCDVDWNQEAVRAATSLLSISSYSRTAVIDDLSDSGFTSEEAVYGADNCNADWNSEALEAATIYSQGNHTKEEIMDYLSGYGFTDAEAEYGANNIS